MRTKLNILVGTLAVGIPMSAAAQYGGQGMGQQAPAQASQMQQNNMQTQTNEVTPAAAADVKAGATVHDQKGGVVGKIESVDSEGAVVSTGTAKAKIPLSSIAKGEKGLTISMTKAELDAAAKEKEKKPK
jgi:hypothetical protein